MTWIGWVFRAGLGTLTFMFWYEHGYPDTYPGCHVKRRVLHEERIVMCPATSKGGQAGIFEEQCAY